MTFAPIGIGRQRDRRIWGGVDNRVGQGGEVRCGDGGEDKVDCRGRGRLGF